MMNEYGREQALGGLQEGMTFNPKPMTRIHAHKDPMKKGRINVYVEHGFESDIARGFDEIVSNVHRINIETTDEAIKNALIELGWTPPKEEQ
jgi:hypothetical protein